jgi:hypothetical protein
MQSDPSPPPTGVAAHRDVVCRAGLRKDIDLFLSHAATGLDKRPQLDPMAITLDKFRSWSRTCAEHPDLAKLHRADVGPGDELSPPVLNLDTAVNDRHRRRRVCNPDCPESGLSHWRAEPAFADAIACKPSPDFGVVQTVQTRPSTSVRVHGSELAHFFGR